MKKSGNFEWKKQKQNQLETQLPPSEFNQKLEAEREISPAQIQENKDSVSFDSPPKFFIQTPASSVSKSPYKKARKQNHQNTLQILKSSNPFLFFILLFRLCTFRTINSTIN